MDTYNLMQIQYEYYIDIDILIILSIFKDEFTDPIGQKWALSS